MILRLGEEITGQLEDDYHTLERLLKEIAKEKGLAYRVKDWEKSYYGQFRDQDGKPYFSNFTGYEMVHGLFLPRTILQATFDEPEQHYFRRPEGATKEYRLLAAKFDPFYFVEERLKERLKITFPHRDVHLIEDRLQQGYFSRR